MYKELVEQQRMTDIEAAARYPDNFILMRMDGFEESMGTVLYIGDDDSELMSLLDQLENPLHCGIIEGLNHRMNSLGGIVAYG